MESSFYENVFLLTQAVPPSKEFLKHFKEGMFSKPNTVGFLHVSHYLLMIYDAERCKKLIQWPVVCKKMEAKYRTDVKEFLTVVMNENPDMDCPPILASHLLHAGGTKFSMIMWCLSTVALRAYIQRETGEVELMAPKSGVGEDLSMLMLNNAIKESTKRIEDLDAVMTKNKQEAEQQAQEMAESIKKNQEELFLTRESLKNLASEAPVHPEIKKRLADPNDTEVIQMWKNSYDETVNYLKIKQQKLNEITELSNNVAAIVASIASSDTNVLDNSLLPKIDINSLSEAEWLSPEAQVILHRLYDDNGNLVLNNLLLLFSLVIADFRRSLERNKFPDLSACELQVKASCEDIKSVSNLIRELLEKIADISSRARNMYDRDSPKKLLMEFDPHPMGNDLYNSVILKSSPVIRINVIGDSGRLDIHGRLELTPVDNTKNKALFSRHQRNEDVDTPQTLTKIRPKLLVSRVNFDDTESSNSSERMSPISRGPNSKLTNILSTTNRSGKYSRLFQTYTKKPSKAFTSTMLSGPSSSRINSTTDMNATCDVYNASELQQHVTSKNTFDNRDMYTPPKRSAKIGASSTIIDAVKPIPVINEFTELVIASGSSPQIRQNEKHADRGRRLSISDLVERYKKLHEKSNDVTAHCGDSSDSSD